MMVNTDSKYIYYAVMQYVYEDVNSKKEHIGFAKCAHAFDTSGMTKNRMEYLQDLLLAKIVDRYANRKITDLCLINVILLGLMSPETWSDDMSETL